MNRSRSRRSFLSGAAVTVALPFLPSALWTRRAGAAACTPPRRFMAWFVPNGFNMPDWTPSTAGTSTWEPTPIETPLEPLRKKLLILTGLDHENIAMPAGAAIGPHAAGVGCFLNMVSVSGHEIDPSRTSLDQALLPALIPPGCGTLPLLRSLQIGVQGDNGLCDRADCIFSRALSWNRGVPLPNIWDPQICFDRMFAGGSPAVAATAAAQRLVQHTSVLDPVRSQAGALTARLNPSDRRAMDAFSTSVREVEKRLQLRSATTPVTSQLPACVRPTRPDASPELNFIRGITPSAIVEGHTAIFVDLMAVAFQCDITRAITFMVGNGNSNNDFEFLTGSSTPHHGTSNHGGNPAVLAKLTKIDTWEISQAADLLLRFDAMIEADGKSVLDHTTFYLSSDVGDGNAHNHWDVPVLLAGGASGALQTDGRHINYTPTLTFPRPLVGPRSDVQTGRVFMSILQAHGIQRDTFGMATGGPLPELLT